MIKGCENILECENKLRLITQKVSLLGEYPLSIEDLDKLGSYIKKQISENIQEGTEFLKTKTPTCFACFLVWKGILDYRDGDYWSGFREIAGLSDPNWQAKWGEIFINFLKANGLVLCDIEDAHRYVTPILLHGMIPNSCLDEYFEKILFPIVKRELLDSTERKEIRFLLRNRREDNEERKVIEEEIRKLQTEKRQISSKLSRGRSLIKIWDDLDRIKALEQKVGNFDELASLPEAPLEYKSKKNSAIQNLEKEIEELAKEERQYEQKRKKFSELNKKGLANSDAIIQCVDILPGLEQELGKLTNLKTQENLLKEQMEKHAQSIFSERWDERYALLIRKLPLDNLKDKIEALNSRRISDSGVRQGYFENILRVIKKWMNHFFSRFIKREKTAQEISVKISEMLKELPIDEKVIKCPQTELVYNLKQLYDNHETICHLREIRNSAERKTGEQISWIKNVAEVVGVDITDNIRTIVTSLQNKLADVQENEQSANQAEQQIEEIKNSIKELMVKKGFLVEELQEIDNCLAKLGNGDIQLGIEQLKRRRDAQREAESLRNDLMRIFPDLDSLEREKDETQRNGKDKRYYNSEINSLDVEIQRIKQRITELVEKLKQISVPFPYVDEPIRRFLLYGGDTARDFLIQSVQMVNQTIKEQKVPSADEIGLPERVVARFEEWWEEHDVTDGEGEEDEIIGLKRFRSPVIYLDTAIGEVKVRFSSQRFSIPDKITEICLIINEDKLDSQKEQIRVYKYNEELLETEELDFSLPFPLTCYEFTLKNGSQVIRSWNIHGISPDHPFMAFDDDSKKLNQEKELPKGRIWFVLHNSFVLNPQVIIEEASLYGKWREYKYRALDLSDVEQLDLVDKQGEKKSIPISQERIFEPVLCGNPLRGCRSKEENIYVGEPPSILVPIESDAEIRGWIISIHKDNDSTLDESKYYRLNDLEEILSIDVNEGIYKIPLSNEKCIGKSPAGKFTARLKNDIKNIDKRFCFCVVPHLKVKFDKDIYLPCREDTSQAYLILDGSEKMEFEPQSPVKIIDHKGGSYRIETTSTERSIHGVLRYPFFKDNVVPVPITIEIPRLTWRLDGLQNNKYSSESNRIEEIWFGDWEIDEESLFLIVSMPPFVCGQGQLSLCNSERRSEAKITEGKARFDLLGFSDTLRAGEPLQTFQLTVPDSKSSIVNVPLFHIRTIWEVEDLKCEKSVEGEKRILNIRWSEKGKAENRVVRLWSLKSGKKIHEEQIMKNSFSIIITKPIVDILDGEYLIQIAEEDPWSATEIRFPGESSPNTRVVYIGMQEPVQEFCPLVICPGRTNKKRKAKGFSRKELLDAGVKLDDIPSLKITFDKRRKSSHTWNIEDLKGIKRRINNNGT